MWWILAACGSSPPTPTDADRRVVLTAAAVAPYAMLPGTLDPTKEKWSMDHTGGAWTIDYEYADDRLLVQYSAVVEDSVADVAWVYAGYALGRSFVEGTDGVELVDAPGVLAWGDEAECDRMRTSSVDVGFVCRGRHGPRAFLAAVAGIHPQGEAAPGRLLAGPLAALDQWTGQGR